MEIFLTVIALTVFSLAAFFAKPDKSKNNLPTIPPPTILTTPETVPTIPIIPTPPKIHSPKPVPSSVLSSSNTNLSDFVYPGSQIVSSSTNTLSLTSTDDPNTILKWYSQKFSHGFSSNKTSNNNTNGNTSAKIDVSSSSQEINISVTKNNSELYTHIEISIKSS